jgi:hypothetical protein
MVDPWSTVYRKLVVFMLIDKKGKDKTRVPDDDPRRGSKHVGLAYRYCNIYYLKQ